MVLYAIRVSRSRDVDHWLNQTKIRSKEPSMLKNPFTMRFKRIKTKDGLILLFDVKPLYPNFTVFGWPLALVIYIILGLNFWVFPGMVLGLLGFFWTSHFYFWMSKIGIKRTGYTGKFQRIKMYKLVEEVMF